MNFNNQNCQTTGNITLDLPHFGMLMAFWNNIGSYRNGAGLSVCANNYTRKYTTQ